jgi:arylsulfatase A-like enzyme
MNRLLAALAATALIQCSAVAGQNADRPAGNDLDLSCQGCNVVFLNIDLLRADFVGILNGGSTYTPNIDAFFKNAIIFHDVSASSGVTAISNTATLTARHGEFTYGLLQRTYVDVPPQMPFRHAELYSKTPTIAETLKLSGYKTININHGWYAGKQMLLDRGIDVYWGSGEVGASDNVPGIVIRKTMGVLKEHTKALSPFFLLMRSEDLRGLPYRYPIGRPRFEDPRVEYRRLAEENYDIYFQPLYDGSLSVKFPSSAKINWMSDAQVEEYRQLSYALYRQQLQFVDEELGQLFGEISGTPLGENTIVVLYANHGDGLYDNRVANHGVSYQTCVSVPLLIRHPKIKSQIRIREPVALIDLVPSIDEMLSVSPPQDTDGVSLLNIVRGLSSYPNAFFFGTDKESKYVRKGQYKLIVWSDRTKELYDLKDDPRERKNLAAELPMVANELYQRLVSHEVVQLRRVLGIVGVDKRPIGRAPTGAK